MYNYNGLDKVYWSNSQQIVFGVKLISSDCTNRHECFPIGDTIAESKSLHGKIIKESKVYDLDSLKFSSNLGTVIIIIIINVIIIITNNNRM